LGPGVYKVHWKDRVGLTALISEFCLFVCALASSPLCFVFFITLSFSTFYSSGPYHLTPPEYKHGLTEFIQEFSVPNSSAVCELCLVFFMSFKNGKKGVSNTVVLCI
jgi:hypothetical protein